MLHHMNNTFQNTIFYMSVNVPLINKRERTGKKHLNDSKVFFEYSNDLDDIHKNVEENNPDKKPKMLVLFDYMIADMVSNKNLEIVTEL